MNTNTDKAKATLQKPVAEARIACRDANRELPDNCGQSIEASKVDQWERGEITGRYRCPLCVRRLLAVNN